MTRKDIQKLMQTSGLSGEDKVRWHFTGPLKVSGNKCYLGDKGEGKWTKFREIKICIACVGVLIL